MIRITAAYNLDNSIFKASAFWIVVSLGLPVSKKDFITTLLYQKGDCILFNLMEEKYQLKNICYDKFD